jgi:hypothetical protein
MTTGRQNQKVAVVDAAHDELMGLRSLAPTCDAAAVMAS